MNNTQIRALRTRLELSVSDFAEILNVSKDTVYSWELGRRVPMGLVQKVLALISEDQAIYQKFVRMTEAQRQHKKGSAKSDTKRQ